MKCTSCGLKLDARKKRTVQVCLLSIAKQKFLANLTQKDYWSVFVAVNAKLKPMWIGLRVISKDFTEKRKLISNHSNLL